MKKFLYTIVGFGALLTTSCNMDLEPVGVILDDVSVESENDCFMFRNGIYGNIRALSTGSYISDAEIQMDGFIGLITNGNRLGALNNGTLTSNDTDIEGIWGGLYNAIADVNYFMERAQKLLDENRLANEDEVREVNRYIAEAKFGRAYFYYWLLDHFCPNYTDQNKDQLLGLPLADKYNPTADKSTYIGRSSLDATYTFIEKDLEDAYNGIKAYIDYQTDKEHGLKGTELQEFQTSVLAPMASYINTWTVKALQARLALLKQDYNRAYTLAEDIITNGNYTLSSRGDYANMWKNDTNNELIFRPTSTKAELGIGATGGAWIGASNFQADYMPMPFVAEAGASNLYNATTDVRFSTFISTRELLTNGELVKIPIFVKYPGNPILDTYAGTNSLLNMAKPFRLSEQYLIAAEAAYYLGKTTEANSRLDDLRKNRLSRYTTPTTPYTGDALRDEIRLERQRELIGEGFRMSDLRRWGLGFNRTDVTYINYPQAASVTVGAGREVEYQPNDYRYVWPIPSSELQVNPQIAGQQNPGY